MNCPRCREKAIFYEQRRALTNDGYTEISIGLLSCPVCGHEELTCHEIIPYTGKSNLEER